MAKLSTFLGIFIIILPAYCQDSPLPALFQEFNNENIAEGKYSYGYSTVDNTNVRQDGRFQNDGTYIVEGSYSYIDAQTRTLYSVYYYADKNGYHPRISIVPIGAGTGSAYGGFGARQVATMLG